MASQSFIVSVGLDFLNRHPRATDDELQSFLCDEFLIRRDLELSVMRGVRGGFDHASAAMFLALPIRFLRRLFIGPRERQEELVRQQVDEAIRELRAFEP